MMTKEERARLRALYPDTPLIRALDAIDAAEPLAELGTLAIESRRAFKDKTVGDKAYGHLSEAFWKRVDAAIAAADGKGA